MTSAENKRYLHQLQEKYNKFHRAPKFDLNSEELYCVCRRPDDGELMVACDGCDEWYHFKCMHLDKKHKDLVSNYYCEFCDQLFHKGKTLWKRKCRLPECYKPAAIDPTTGKVSKYCSEEHGLQFIRQYVLSKVEKSDNGDSLGDLFTQCNEGYSQFETLGKSLPVFDKGKVEYSLAVKEELSSIDMELGKLEEAEKLYTGKEKYLAKLREKIKCLDEVLSNEIDEKGDGVNEASKKGARGKKSKKTKIDLCGYDTNLRLLGKDWIKFASTERYRSVVNFSGEESIDSKQALRDLRLIREQDTQDDGETSESEAENSEQSAMIDQEDTIFQGLCLKERRKCTKHLTWHSIIADSLDWKLAEVTEKITKLKERKEKIKQAETVRQWEEWTAVTKIAT
ncbi:DEKNAAC103424 [Brettanomyces naardenensis]|uniref:DEKNAAC103424 n=1 Tax=Brettanomyces naardenensis TaxID=13370 RepID=A0A448YP53_BRENA|nr:DEKNAAC103424 [Brettanomyces naardenensis]